MAVFFAPDELVALILRLPQSLVSQIEAFVVLIAMIFDARVMSIGYFSRFLPSQVELFDGVLAQKMLSRLTQVRVVVVDLPLCLELVVTLFPHLLHRAI